MLLSLISCWFILYSKTEESPFCLSKNNFLKQSAQVITLQHTCFLADTNKKRHESISKMVLLLMAIIAQF